MSTSPPKDCLFNEGHLWCRCESEDTVVIGVSHHAQNSLGEITYVELPDTGSVVTQDESLGIIESTKVVNELVAPVSGTVIERNDSLSDNPTAVNEDPYNEGWMLKIKIDSTDQLKKLMDKEQYAEFIA